MPNEFNAWQHINVAAPVHLAQAAGDTHFRIYGKIVNGKISIWDGQGAGRPTTHIVTYQGPAHFDTGELKTADVWAKAEGHDAVVDIKIEVI